jgi:hypothetical protein
MHAYRFMDVDVPPGGAYPPVDVEDHLEDAEREAT